MFQSGFTVTGKSGFANQRPNSTQKQKRTIIQHRQNVSITPQIQIGHDAGEKSDPERHVNRQ